VFIETDESFFCGGEPSHRQSSFFRRPNPEMPLGERIFARPWSFGMPQKQESTRRHPRAKAPGGMMVAWQSGTLRSVSFLESIALGGLFIRTPNPPPIRSLVKVLIELPHGDVNARAIVRRVTPSKGMGVEFIAMTQESRAMLRQVLRPLLPEEPS
jgi:PilZ domain